MIVAIATDAIASERRLASCLERLVGLCLVGMAFTPFASEQRSAARHCLTLSAMLALLSQSRASQPHAQACHRLAACLPVVACYLLGVQARVLACVCGGGCFFMLDAAHQVEDDAQDLPGPHTALASIFAVH